MSNFKKFYYYAMINEDEYVNYLSLQTDRPIRLKNTKSTKETILYSEKEVAILKDLDPNLFFIPNITNIYLNPDL